MVFRRRRWEILSELIDEIGKDPLLDNCRNDLSCICYAPNIGYRSWIFSYKKVYVALFDSGNGYYSFHMPVTRFDVLMASLLHALDKQRSAFSHR